MKRIQSLILLAGSVSLATVLGASVATAQTKTRTITSTAALSTDDGVEIVRDGIELRDELLPRDIDHDIADTALVFTNLGGRVSRVRCVAYDANGQPIGRAWLRVPALGVRFMLASDMANGSDFIGHAQCGALNAVRGTAVFLGGGVTDLPSMQPRRFDGRIRFPLVATY